MSSDRTDGLKDAIYKSSKDCLSKDTTSCDPGQRFANGGKTKKALCIGCADGTYVSANNIYIDTLM